MMTYKVEVLEWKEKKLEKVMLDYVRWIFKLDFCAPRYLILKELDLDKLKLGGKLE